MSYKLDNQSPSFVTGTTAASGNTTIIAAPLAGNRLVISAVTVQNETTTAQTLKLRFGTTDKWRVLAQNQGDGIAFTFERGREWRLDAAEALVLNLSAAAQVGYSVAYYTEAVG